MFRQAIAVVGMLGFAGCVRAPTPVDVVAMVRAHGEADAHISLTARVLDHPRDIGARLALAELAERMGRPSEAIDQLTTVEHLGGPLGTRWHDADRQRLGRLLLARGRTRLARGASSALADLEHAGKLGVPASAADLLSARLAIAFGLLRQVDGELRAKGRAMLAAQTGSAKPGTDEATWIGARDNASPADRGVFGAWLWTIGARREAYEQLAAWHAATKSPRDEKLQAAYLRAVAWWSPIWLGDVPPPPADDLVGPERCWFPGAACTPPPIEEAPLPPVPIDARPTWDVAAARYASTRLVGTDGSTRAPGTDAAKLAPIVVAYGHDPAIAGRLARDLVAQSVDAAAGHAAVGALFDGLDDPARARAAWQAAVDASPEPAFQRGLAEAAAHAGDGPGAAVVATGAAAASGDPAVVWAALAVALLDGNRPVDALEASRTALDLAGPDVLPGALDTAIAASRAVGRAQQADALLVQRAQVAPRKKTDDTELRAALAAHRAQPTASTVARLWVASRDQPRDVESRIVLMHELDPDDSRRVVIANELLELAGDPDSERARAAALALRR